MTKKNNPSGETNKRSKNMNALTNNHDSQKILRADAKENRDQILQAASKIFAEKGLSVPISEIAHEAGIGIGTVYRHFPNKEALFNAINHNYKQRFTEEARSLINHTDPGKAFFDFIFHVMEECFANKALRDSFKAGTICLRKATSGVWLDFQMASADILIRAQQEKAVREDVEILDLFILMSGLLATADEPDDASNLDRFHRLLSVVFDGLRYKTNMTK